MVSSMYADHMMTNDFGKHYASMYTGSMRGKGALMFAVMGYVIANQVPEATESQRMVVELNPEVVAFLLGETEQDVRLTLVELCSPDARSRSKEEGGRRLVKLGEFLYWVVNGRKYREWNREERRREQNREAKRRQRVRTAKGSGPLPGEVAAVAAEKRGDLSAADFITTGSLPQKAQATIRSLEVRKMNLEPMEAAPDDEAF